MKSFNSIKRKTIRISMADLVKVGPLEAGKLLPSLIMPQAENVSLAQWTGESREIIAAHLAESGGILFRGFDVKSAADFEQVINSVGGQSLEYSERSSPRSQISGNIYTSTDYPADQSIFVHNENSYQQNWPMMIFFFCERAASAGGATPIADCRNVFRRISTPVKERFRHKKWMYVRNFGGGFGLDWQTVFRTADRKVVEQYCRKNGIEAEWRKGDRLRTRAVRPAIVRHPRTGEEVWFNHATFFHVTTLGPAVREALLREFEEDELPTNSFYGDGSPIEASALDELREIYRQETVTFQWNRGDVLLLDNMLVAHGREPYVGPRSVLVGMAEPVSWEAIRTQE
jgi:alpha-ketoglutarate-dependent taurine dioxygenase